MLSGELQRVCDGVILVSGGRCDLCVMMIMKLCRRALDDDGFVDGWRVGVFVRIDFYIIGDMALLDPVGSQNFQTFSTRQTPLLCD